MRSFKLDPSLQRSHTKMGAQPTVSRAVPTLGGGGTESSMAVVFRKICGGRALPWCEVTSVLLALKSGKYVSKYSGIA